MQLLNHKVIEVCLRLQIEISRGNSLGGSTKKPRKMYGKVVQPQHQKKKYIEKIKGPKRSSQNKLENMKNSPPAGARKNDC